jgi:hypothetical protein
MSQGQSSSKTMDIALVEDSPAGSDGDATGRPVLRRRRLTIYSLSSILWPPVKIGRGVPFHSDWIQALDQETNDHRLMNLMD